MKKKEIIKDSKKFSEIIKTSKYKKNNHFVIYYNNSEVLEIPMFGITVPTKLGNAVTRNKIKRQVKDIIDKNKFLFKKDREYIIMIRRGSEKLSYQQLTENLISLIKKVNT